ncbi:MAG: class D sortase [Xanthomonadales bacterium]
MALLAVFFVIRGDEERARQEGIEAFERALQHASASERTVPARSAARTAREEAALPDTLPDDFRLNQDQWNAARVSQYAASLEAGGEPPLGVLRIDKLNVAVPVYDGTGEETLHRGVGRVRGTARIDAVGNLGIAGHRDSFFRPLKDIQEGDRIELRTAAGTVTYSVSSITIVEPEDVSVLAPTPERTLTLVTCYPFYYVGHAPKRFIVTATAEHSLAKT